MNPSVNEFGQPIGFAVPSGRRHPSHRALLSKAVSAGWNRLWLPPMRLTSMRPTVLILDRCGPMGYGPFADSDAYVAWMTRG